MSVDIPLNIQQSSGLTLTWKDLSVWVKRKKSTSFWGSKQYEHVRILNKVNGIAKSGTLVAIMGASGAGKTTLLATISQRIKGNTVGEILVNGRDVDKALMANVSGFVPQEELITKTLTVKEHMQFMAILKMDRRVKTSSRNRRITSLIIGLGLKKCAYTQLSGLSGGELRRVSLAVQLLTDPPLLFCDEPTTGLDSYNAGIVVEKLREFAIRGKTVICTIHQPASGIFELFHQVLLLAGGRVAFHGSVSEAAEHFNKIGLQCPIGFNQSEFYVSQLAVVVGKEEESSQKIQYICDQFDTSKYGHFLNQQLLDKGVDSLIDFDNYKSQNINNSYDMGSANEFQKYTNIKKINILTQLYWLTWRSLIDMKRNIKEIFFRFSMYMFIAFLVAIPYINMVQVVDQKDIQNMQGLLYLIITETVFTFSYTVFNTFPKEIPQLLREIGNGLYSATPYYVSKVLVLIPQAIIEPFIYTTVIYWTVGLKGNFIDFLIFCVPVIVCAISATAFGCVMSASFETVASASLVSVPIDFITVLFSGLFVNLAHVPSHLGWIKYISPFYYGTEAISILQWQQIQNISCSSQPGMPCISTAHEVLEKYGYVESDFHVDLLGLAIYSIVCHVIGFLALLKRSKKEAIY